MTQYESNVPHFELLYQKKKKGEQTPFILVELICKRKEREREDENLIQGD